MLRELAAAGYLVVAVPMPFNRAVLAPNRATAVRAAFPEIRRWIIAGHSLGGAMAARYASMHQEELAGLIVWDSHPPEANSLADSRLPVVHIHRATLEGAPPRKFHEKRHLFPAGSRWIPIPGGIHMDFGSFRGGGYEEEWSPGITRDEQHRIEIGATLDAIATMSR